MTRARACMLHAVALFAAVLTTHVAKAVDLQSFETVARGRYLAIAADALVTKYLKSPGPLVQI